MALVPGLCLGGDVKTVAAQGVDFSRYKTYHLLPSKFLTKSGVVDGDPKLGPMIAKSINEQLAKKGFAEVPQGGDIEVVTWALSESVPQLEAVLFAPYGLHDVVPHAEAALCTAITAGTTIRVVEVIAGKQGDGQPVNTT